MSALQSQAGCQVMLLRQAEDDPLPTVLICEAEAIVPNAIALFSKGRCKNFRRKCNRYAKGENLNEKSDSDDCRVGRRGEDCGG